MRGVVGFGAERDTGGVPTATRAAKNESLFRQVNERINEIQQGFESADAVGFVCECSDEQCTTQVSLNLAEYGEVRAGPAHFLVAPGHVDLEHERVIDSNDRYAIVEKFGLAGRIAEQEAP